MDPTLIIAAIAALASIASAIYAASSARASRAQADYITKKVGMVADPEKMFEVLPAWYIERMATDDWCFGLLLSSGSILAINRLEAISDDKLWIEVQLASAGEGPKEFSGIPVIYGLDDRRHASVRVDRVQAAFELVTS